jgi:hypothetical protein
MKNLRLQKARLLLLCFFLIPLFSSAQQSFQVSCVGFYNLENLFDTINQADVNDEDFTPAGANNYTPQVYQDKLHRLATVLSQIATEVTPDGLAMFGSAEVENRSVLEDLAAQPELKSRNYKIIHYNSPDERGIDVCLFYNPKYFRPLSSESLRVPLVSKEGAARPTRDVLHACGILAGDTVHVYVNHWPSRRGGEEASAPGRALAAGVAKANMDSIASKNPGAKFILMGDLNDDPVSPSVAKVLGAKGKAEDVKPGGLFNPWVDFYKKGIGTLAYNDSWNLFDQIVISEPFLNKDQSGLFFMKASIYKKDFMIQHSGRYRGYPLRTYNGNRYVGGYSDHFPVYIVLLKKK